MTKRQKEPDDWSGASEALFHSSREDYAPTAADRARVRNALAQRLAETSTESAAGGDEAAALLGKDATRGTLSYLVKVGIGLGVACLMAGVFAVMRANDSKQPDPKPAAAETTAVGAMAAKQELQPTVPMQEEAAAPLKDEPVAGVRPANAAAVRGAAKSARVRPTEPKVAAESARVRAGSHPKLTAAKTATASASRPKLSAANPAVGVQSGANGTETASKTAVVNESTSSNVLAHRAEAHAETVPSPAPTASQTRVRPAANSAIAEDSADVRAELAFVARINAAMLDAKLRTVLALCAEHERRWPNGTFVQEREGLRAIASCGSRATDAEVRARAFLASYPRAPLVPRVRNACAKQLTAAGQE